MLDVLFVLLLTNVITDDDLPPLLRPLVLRPPFSISSFIMFASVMCVCVCVDFQDYPEVIRKGILVVLVSLRSYPSLLIFPTWFSIRALILRLVLDRSLAFQCVTT